MFSQMLPTTEAIMKALLSATRRLQATSCKLQMKKRKTEREGEKGGRGRQEGRRKEKEREASFVRTYEALSGNS